MTEIEYREKIDAAGLSYEAATLAMLFAHAEDPCRSHDEARDRGWEMLQEGVTFKSSLTERFKPLETP